MSKRSDAYAEIIARLETILPANGFNTSVGAKVYGPGELPLAGPDDPAGAVAVVVRDDEPGYQGESVFVVLPVDVQAYSPAGGAAAWLGVEDIVEDVKRAIETSRANPGQMDHDLDGVLLARGLTRGSTRVLERDPGSAYVGAAVEYRLMLKELWGAP